MSETKGFVYVFWSPNCEFVKIGLTTKGPLERAKQVNMDPEYGPLGPWAIADFLHVHDCGGVERLLHSQFSRARVTVIPRVRELFRLSVKEARDGLERVPVELRVDHRETEALFKDRRLLGYLLSLFEQADLFRHLDLQEAWTLSLFPGTGRRGRLFTLNIRNHEVAFCTRPDRDGKHLHCLVMDQLIEQYDETLKWVEAQKGWLEQSPYKTAGEGSVSVFVAGGVELGQQLLAMPGVRRAMFAYWGESLAIAREMGTRAMFARYHRYDAVHALVNENRARNALNCVGPIA